MTNLSSTVVGTLKIEDAMLVCKTTGTFTHRDISAEYKEEGKYQTFWYGTSTGTLTLSQVTVIFAIFVPLSWWLIRFFACRNWEQDARLDVTSPTFTDVHLYCHEGGNKYSYSAASPAVGTVAMNLENSNETLKWSLYYRPQVSPPNGLHTPECILSGLSQTR